MALSLWCIQCGVSAIQTPAIGKNEDGDQACRLHGGLEPMEHRMEQSSTRSTRSTLEPVSYTKVADFHAMGERFCSFEGCGKKLRSDNHADLCKIHRYVKKNAERKKQQQALRQDAIKTSPAEVIDDQVQPARLTTATITVTEAMLDNYWNRLPIDLKAQVIQNLLEDLPGA